MISKHKNIKVIILEYVRKTPRKKTINAKKTGFLLKANVPVVISLSFVFSSIPMRNEWPNVMRVIPNQIKLTVHITIANTFKIGVFQKGFPVNAGKGKPKTPADAA